MLGFHRRHAAAGRAPVEIGVLHRSAIIGLREQLAGHGDVVLRTIEEVGDLRRVALAVRGDDPVRIGAVAGMAGVGDDDDIALAECRRAVRGVHRRGEGAGIAADAHGEEALLPGIGQLYGGTGRAVRRALAMRDDGGLHRAMRRDRAAGGAGVAWVTVTLGTCSAFNASTVQAGAASADDAVAASRSAARAVAALLVAACIVPVSPD